MAEALKGTLNNAYVRSVRRNPQIGMFALGTVLLVASLLATYRHAGFTSDDVMFQNALLHWRPFSGDIFFDNQDGTFIAQAPLYWLVSLVVAPGRHALLADGILLSLINFGLVYYSLLYFLRVFEIKVTWLTLSPTLLLSAFGYGLNRLYIGANYHTLSIGLIFVLLTLISKLCRRELGIGKMWSRVLVGAGIAVLVGAAIVNDRYFVYFGFVPALALTALLLYKKIVSIKRASAVFTVLIAGYGVAIIIKHLLPHIGIVLTFGVGAPNFVAFSDFGNNLMNALHSLLYIFGINFFGQPVASAETVASFICAVVLIVTIVTSIERLRSPDAQPELTVLCALFWFAVIAYAVSSFNLGTVQTFRYLAIVPFLAIPILSVRLSLLGLSRVSRIALVSATGFAAAVCIGVNGLGSVSAAAATMIGWSNNNTYNLQLTDALKSAGVSKGYAEYWNSHINTYLSGGNVSIQPVLCDGGTTVPYQAFVDYDALVKPSTKSFYMFVPKAPLCTEAQVQSQFGEPSKRLNLSGNEIWIYNYDINRHMNMSSLR